MGTNWSTSSTLIGTGCGALAPFRPPFAIHHVIQPANHAWVFLAFSKIALHPDGDTLSITGFYGTQYVFERAYGNFLGSAGSGDF